MINNAGTQARVASDSWTVVPSDTVRWDNEAAGIYVGVAGNITIVKRNGTLQQFLSCGGAGYILPHNCIGVMATGTTALGLVALV